MMSYRWHYPVDPDCPDVLEYYHGFYDDSIMQQSGCADEFSNEFERGHISKCKRCMEYGASNVEVID